MRATAKQPQRAPDGVPVHYKRHRPQQTALYRLVQQHAASFIAHAEASTGAELPRFIKDEFDAFLECGILAHGFLRLRCGECGHDKLVAFSCKRRGLCPSCGARRMSQTAAHLIDHVIPHVPVRQWVLSLPIPLRVLLAAQPQLVTPVLQVVQRVITRHLLDAAELPADEGQGGAVTLIQRFGSADNLNIHLHCLVLNGVYRCGADGAPTFVETEAPTDDELHALLQTVITRLMKMLTRRGVLVEEMGQTYLTEPDADDEDARTLRPLQAAAVTYRIAFGPRAGQKVLTLRGTKPHEAPAHQPLCADIDGFSLHVAVGVEAHDRKRLERLCRYITRPALSDERVQLNAAGQVELKLKTPWRDGTTHLVTSPLEFMQGLPALVPRPRLHLIRFHGVLAPNAKLRPLVVPPQGLHVQEAASEAAVAAECEVESLQPRPNRISWARLLKRVFDIDMQHCPNCGAGELKIIAAILERPVIEKILTHPPGAGSAATTQSAGAQDGARLKPPGPRRSARTPDALNPAVLPSRSLGGAAPHIDLPPEGQGCPIPRGRATLERPSGPAKSGQGNGPDPSSKPSALASAGYEAHEATRPRPFEISMRVDAADLLSQAGTGVDTATGEGECTLVEDELGALFGLDMDPAAAVSGHNPPVQTTPREASAPRPPKARAGRTQTPDATRPTAKATARPRSPAVRLLAALRRAGWLDNANARAATGLDADSVRLLLKQLVADRHARVEGQRRGTRYVAVQPGRTT